MSNRDEIAREALTLSPDDRAYMADVLERSLESDSFGSPELAEAWSKVVNRRIEAYRRGETQALDIETSNARLRVEFGRRR